MMNERIKELVIESGNGQMRNGKLYPHIGSRTEEDWKKFAELIVRECMEQVWYTREDKIDETISQNIKARMATHFGVEE